MAFPALPANYITINHLKERFLKEQEREKAAAEAEAKNVVVPVMQSDTIAVLKVPRQTKEGEKASTEVIRRIGNQKGREGENGRWRERSEVRSSGAEMVENSKRREKSSTEEVFQRRMVDREERGDWKRREMEEDRWIDRGERERKRRQKAERNGTGDIRSAGVGGNQERGESRRNWPNKRNERMEKAKAKADGTLVAEMAAEEKVPEIMRDKKVDCGGRLEEGENRGEKINRKRKKKYNKQKGKAKGKETLGEKSEEEKVLAAVCGIEEERETVVVNGRVYVKKITWVPVDSVAEIDRSFEDFPLKGGSSSGIRRENWVGDISVSDRKTEVNDRMAEITRKVEDLSVVVGKGGNVQGDRTAENGRRVGKASNCDKNEGDVMDVRKSGSGDPTTEIRVEIGDSLASGKRKEHKARDGKENVEGDRTAEIGWRGLHRKGGNAGRNKVGQGFRGLDTSLVWVRKEDKSEVCVAGNCREGVLAKAGEREKRPGRGRP